MMVGLPVRIGWKFGNGRLAYCGFHIETPDTEPLPLKPPARLTSTTPLQALYLLNDAFVHEQASGFARRVLAERFGVSAEGHGWVAVYLAHQQSIDSVVTAQVRANGPETVVLRLQDIP
jgi:hypothetical protein